MNAYEFRFPEQPTPGLTATGAGRAKVEVEGGRTFSFGVMQVHDKLSHSFVLKNVGDAPLILTKGKPTCKCTISELEMSEVPPGGQCKVTVEWHPEYATESFNQTAPIHTNDPGETTVELRVGGIVRAQYKVDPENISLGQFAASEGTSFDVFVWSFGEKHWEMKSLQYERVETQPFFSLTSRELTSEERSRRPEATHGQALRLTVKPGLPLGNVEQTLTLEHNFDPPTPVSLHIHGKAVGDFTVLGPDYDNTHEYVALGNIRAIDGRKSKVTILVKGPHREATKLRLKSVDPDGPLNVTLGEPTTIGKAVSWPVQLEIPPNSEPISRLGTQASPLARVEFETDHPDTPLYTLKLRFAVTPDQ
jgi:hypothetical protein